MEQKLNQCVSADAFLPGLRERTKGINEAGKEILRILNQEKPRRINRFQQHPRHGVSRVPSKIDESAVMRLLTTVDQLAQGEMSESEKYKKSIKHTGGYNCKCGNCKKNVLDEQNCKKLLSKINILHPVSSNSSSASEQHSNASVKSNKSETKLAETFQRLAIPKIRKTVSNIEYKEIHLNKWDISNRLDELSKPKLKKEKSEPIILKSLPQVKSDYNKIPIGRIEELAIPRPKIILPDLQIIAKPLLSRDYKCPTRIKELAQPKYGLPKVQVKPTAVTSDSKVSKRICELAKPKKQVQKKKNNDNVKRWNI